MPRPLEAAALTHPPQSANDALLSRSLTGLQWFNIQNQKQTSEGEWGRNMTAPINNPVPTLNYHGYRMNLL